MISILIAQETIGNISPRSTIVEQVQSRAYGYRLGTANPKKHHLVPQNGPKILGPEKSWKNRQTKTIVFEPME
jgi:hypothetical protein